MAKVSTGGFWTFSLGALLISASGCNGDATLIESVAPAAAPGASAPMTKLPQNPSAPEVPVPALPPAPLPSASPSPRSTEAVTPEDARVDPAEVAIGERLFRETRFNQFYFSRTQGNVNAAMAGGDPVLEFLPNFTQQPFKNPYAGQGMNCASCHFIDELQGQEGLGNRAYNDFARRTPIPDRGDGRVTTLRNSPAFVNSTIALEKDYQGRPLFLHYDGEFATAEDLVIGGFTGRNFGWLADEGGTAVAHLAHVVREDDGQGSLAKSYGGSYRDVLLGQNGSLPDKFKLPAEYRVDVAQATDQQILGSVAKLVGAYLKSLIYKRDEQTQEFKGSPYDVFLAKNKLPRKPEAGQTDRDYSRALTAKLIALPLDQVQFVDDGKDGKYKLSKQAFVFGPTELAGFKAFMGPANCVARHTPPSFTDFFFHNTGASQEEYDSIHGKGAFKELSIPTFAERIGHEEQFLGPSAAHPKAVGQFASVPSKERPGFTDLGVWNVFGNPAIPTPQAQIREMLCAKLPANRLCEDAAALQLAIAAFKTPTIRNLGQSAPYLHTGSKDTLEQVVSFYLDFAAMIHRGEVRNPDVDMARVKLKAEDVQSVAAFLRALNEDYN